MLHRQVERMWNTGPPELQGAVAPVTWPSEPLHAACTWQAGPDDSEESAAYLNLSLGQGDNSSWPGEFASGAP